MSSEMHTTFKGVPCFATAVKESRVAHHRIPEVLIMSLDSHAKFVTGVRKYTLLLGIS